jgi:O-antigen/teichoic acid export membrane protein
LAIAGKWLFPFVFGESFVNMYQPFLLLIPGILALSGIFTITAYFAGRNNIRVNITGSVYALVVILVGDIIFIPRYGINAAALVSSLGYITYQIYVIGIFKKEHQSSLSDFFIFRIQDFKQIRRQILTAVKNKNES